MLNPIFWKKVQGQKNPRMWEIAEHQIPSMKVLYKTNAKSNEHPSIRLFIRDKTQLVNQRKQNVAFTQKPRTPQKYSPTKCGGIQLHQ